MELLFKEVAPSGDRVIAAADNLAVARAALIRPWRCGRRRLRQKARVIANSRGG
jgi:hypothetical protein